MDGNFSAGGFVQRKRFSGQKSSSSRTNGSVTTIGLDIRPQAKKNSASQ
jgi:hypothetical protein